MSHRETHNPPSVDVRIVNHPVTLAAMDAYPAQTGGECVFVGRTRQDTHPQHGVLKKLSYEAYPEMAERVLGDLAAQAVAQFGCLFVRVLHAIGEVPVGEGSVLVQVAAGHRDKAFEACRFLIDRLKADAPIWKREVWERGETWSPASSNVAGQPPT